MKPPFPLAGRVSRLVVVLGAFIAASGAVAQSPLSVSSTVPSKNARAVERNSDVSARFSENLDPATVTSSNFVIHSSQTHNITENATWGVGGTGDTALLDLDRRFLPGEEAEVALKTGLTGSGGGTLNKGYVWRFRAKAGVGPADFSRDAPDISTNTTTSYAIATGDFNGDGLPDIVMALFETPNRGLRVFFNDGSGNFSQSPFYASNNKTSIYSLAVGDVDDDGDLDIVAGRQYNKDSNPKLYFSVLKNDGSGSFTETKVSNSMPTSGQIVSIHLADMDGDGDLDTLLGLSQGLGRIYFNSGGSFGGTPASFDAAISTTRLGVGDIDGDGDLDVIVVGNANYQAKPIFLNDGGGGLTKSPATLEATKAYDIVLCDIDGDGHLDAAVANDGTNKWYKNNGSGGFTFAKSFGGSNSKALAAGDVDGDGDMDLVVGNYGSDGFVYFNDGSGKFSKNIKFGGKLYRFGVVLADFDDDGDLDIAETNNNATKKMYRNGDPPLSISGNAKLPNANDGTAYAYTFSAANGSAPYSWSVSPADPGGWLSLNAATGGLSGTAPVGSGNTSLTFDVTVRDNSGTGATKTRTFRLDINPPPPQLPVFEDFENGIGGYSITLGTHARALAHAEAAKNGSKGLILDGTPGRDNWSLQTATPPPGKDAADDPARWFTDGVDHHGMFEWAVEGLGVTDVDVAFHYKIVYKTEKWYSNLIFEWSDDIGQTWHIASGTGATANGVYRGDVEGKAAATWKSANLSIQGLNGAGLLKFRFRWLTKMSLDKIGSESFVAIDNLSVFLPGQAFAILPNSLPNAVDSFPYSQQLTVSGGVPPFAWTVTGLPAWLSWDLATLTLSGTPPPGTAPQSNAVTLTATDLVSASSNRNYTVDVLESVKFTATTLADGVEGATYGPKQLTRTGGVGPFTWALIGGTMPKGLQLDAATGSVSGLLAKGSTGAHVFTVEVTDTTIGHTSSDTVSLTVTPAPALTILTNTLNLQAGKELDHYSTTIQVSGGFAPYTFSAIGGLPSWMNLDAKTGSLGGTPQHGDSRQYSLGIIVTDSDAPANIVVQNYLLDILPGPLPTFSSGPGESAAAGCALAGGSRGAPGWILLMIVLGAACAARSRRKGRAPSAALMPPQA